MVRIIFISMQKNGNNGQGYGWLFDRTKECTTYGCTTVDSSTLAYWTSDACDSSYVWTVSSYLQKRSLTYSHDGIRPVIQIAKS